MLVTQKHGSWPIWELLLQTVYHVAVCIQGYAFCEYQYLEVTDAVIETLNLQTVGSKTLTVKRAVAGQAAPQVPHALPQHVQTDACCSH